MKAEKNDLTSFGFFSKVRILKIFQRTSLLLRIYRSGKIPKLIKTLPFLKNFEEILWLLRPDSWSPQALQMITRFFILTLDNLQIGRFFSQILAPRLQEAIFQSKKISVHLYLCFKLSASRSSSFFSFLIFPLLKGTNCTTKEAIVLGSIINKASFSSTDAIWGLSNLLENPCSNSKLILIRIFLSKNYTLPYRVLDILLDFFLKNSSKFKHSVFKKCLLTFWKNYSISISNEDKKKLSRLGIMSFQSF